MVASLLRSPELEDHAAAELVPRDLSDNVVVKIADEGEVDVSTRPRKISFAEAIPTARRVRIEGNGCSRPVSVPVRVWRKSWDKQSEEGFHRCVTLTNCQKISYLLITQTQS